MTLIHYTFDSERSCVWVSGRSSLHPINTETRGITGWFAGTPTPDGELDPGQPVTGELQLAVERLTSGNQLYDRELRRRMDARHHPIIAGTVVRVAPAATPSRYLVTGEVAFHGKTRSFEHEMRIDISPDGVTLTGEYTFDIREFGMKPPSMLMVRVYPEISVRIELYGTPDG